MRLVIACCGSGAFELHAMGGPSCVPPTGFMGGKRRFAGATLDALGVHRGDVSEVVMVDSSSWGRTWAVVLGPDGARVADVLDAWADEDPIGLWDGLIAADPPMDPIEQVAGWLWVQARSASNVPCWHDGERWQMGEKSAATPRKAPRQKAKGHGESKGPHSTRVVAQRLRVARGRFGALADVRSALAWDAKLLEAFASITAAGVCGHEHPTAIDAWACPRPGGAALVGVGRLLPDGYWIKLDPDEIAALEAAVGRVPCKPYYVGAGGSNDGATAWECAHAHPTARSAFPCSLEQGHHGEIRFHRTWPTGSGPVARGEPVDETKIWWGRE